MNFYPGLSTPFVLAFILLFLKLCHVSFLIENDYRTFPPVVPRDRHNNFIQFGGRNMNSSVMSQANSEKQSASAPSK